MSASLMDAGSATAPRRAVVRRGAWRGIIPGALCPLLASCANGDEATSSALESAREVQQTPALDMILTAVESIDRSLLPDGRTLSIAKPRAAVDLQDRVLVLDSDWRKILAFGVGDGPTHTIGAGYGLQPGQLAMPVEMALHDNAIYVVDYDLKNVTVWDTAGHLDRVVDLSHLRPRGITVTSDGIYVRLMFPERGHWAALVDSLGQVREYVFPMAEHDEPFAKALYGGSLISTWDGSAAIYIHGTGALASIRSQGEVREITLEPVSTLLTDEEGLAYADRAVYDATPLPDGQFLVLRVTRDVSPSEDAFGQYELALYGPDGTLLGVSALPPGSMPLAIDSGASGNSVLVSFLQPRPEVVRYEMEFEQR